ncbi:hypothetical protein PHLCEN_2v5373 [Hermanssonia centrifuga]|uniref:CHAT domain-containing protein n=1 Tax=Hermanssonia centrifuga TaxID=98765 RepID=A0A2R6P5G3_9APHY|nr:hypothetical protein PHLCEN_2v5373 [Hermanssonia centrifuga]
MSSISHRQNAHSDIPHSIHELLPMLINLEEGMKTTQEWDVTDDRTPAVLAKCREGLPLLRPDHPALPLALFYIAEALSRRFEALGEIADIDDSITYFGEIFTIPFLLHNGSLDDEVLPFTALSVSLLGHALMLRYAHSKNSEDVDAAIENYRMTLTLSSPDGATRQMPLAKLSKALTLRFNNGGRKEDVDEAIQWQREAVSLSQKELDDGDTYGSLVESLSQLGNLLGLRYVKFSLIADLEEAVERHETALALLPDSDKRRPRYLRGLAMFLRLTFEAKGQIKDLNGAIDRVREVIACLSSGNAPLDKGETHGSLVDSLHQLGNLLLLRNVKFGLVADLDQATESYGKALILLPDNDERRPRYLRDLAMSLHSTFEAEGQIKDLNGAIDRVRAANTCLSSGNVPLDESEILGSLAQNSNSLGDLLKLRYTNSGMIVDLEQATESYGKALVLLPDDDERRPRYLMDLAMSLHLTFEAEGRIEDLNGAIDCVREAIACLSSGIVPFDEGKILGSLAQDSNSLGDLLKLRHTNCGMIADLEKATESYRMALALLPANSKSWFGYLWDLVMSLQATFEVKGRIEDLSGAIDRVREALAYLSYGNDPPDERETRLALGHLGRLLNRRFRWTGEMADIEEAIQCQYRAMELDATKRHSALGSLSSHLHDLYLRTGDRNDFERALGFSREALELCPVDDSSSRLEITRHMAAYLAGSDRAEDWEEALKIRRELVGLTKGKDGHYKDVIDLVHSLDSQWRRDPGQLSAFDEGIQQLRDVLPSVIHGPHRIDLLERLASFLQNRYQPSRASENMEEAITYLRELTALIPRGHKDHAKFLSNLANALQSRFQLFRRIDDIDDALDSAREAVKIARSGRVRDDLVQCLSMLGLCLSARSGSGDIEEAIAVRRELVSLSPDDGPALRHLALSIITRQVNRPVDNVEEGIVLLRKSLAIIPAGHPEKLRALGALAMATLWQCELGRYQEEALELCREFVAAHRQFDPDNTSYCAAVGQLAKACWFKGDYEEAAIRYDQAANMRYAIPHARFTVTKMWARQARQAGHSSSLRAHTKALELLDQCLTSTPTIDLQHQFLTENASALASNAAACAIEKESLEIAVQVLEQGRALLWSRMRGYRHSIEQLQESNPDLAEEFKGVCQQLEHITVSSEPILPEMAPIPVSTTPYTAQVLDFDAKVTKNRQLSDDYERIISEIRQIDGFSSFLQATPFSTLQTAASEGPVILVNVNEHRSDAIILRATEAPLLVPLPENLFAIVDTLSARLVVVDRINRDEDRKGVARQPKQLDMGNILQLLWESACQPIALALQEMEHPKGSRVWWCPVGRLSALPLHAAGTYDNKGVLIEGFPDLYVSSYTPTLSSLIASRATGGSGLRLLAVGQSNSLPKVKDEFFKLRNLFPSHVLRVRDGERARSDTVLRDLRDHSWVHFACHGSLDASSPFKSGFILHDNKKLSLRDIMQARLPNAELAFLAACHSAAIESESETPDEVLTLAAAMQFCGFRSIVGTLWTMSDEDGPVLAEKFYKHMLRHGLDQMDVRDSAEAVHLATESMRKAKVPLHRWTTFVHVGI